MDVSLGHADLGVASYTSQRPDIAPRFAKARQKCVADRINLKCTDLAKLAAGGTLALMVSFVGTHSGKLQPPWLLRSALVPLVLTMIVAMARNWLYAYYLTGLYGRKYAEAMLNRERAKRDYAVALPPIDPDTMQPHDPRAIQAQFVKDESSLNAKIAECKKQEESAFSQTKWLERTALGLIVAAMAMLVALAWINF